MFVPPWLGRNWRIYEKNVVPMDKGGIPLKGTVQREFLQNLNKNQKYFNPSWSVATACLNYEKMEVKNFVGLSL